jgi:hypothetical protein
MENVPTARIIRKNELGETVKTFDKSTPYESLKPGDVVEVEEESGELRDYYVADMKWDFTHFGDTLQIIIEPVIKKPTVNMVRFNDGITKHLWY